MGWHSYGQNSVLNYKINLTLSDNCAKRRDTCPEHAAVSASKAVLTDNPYLRRATIYFSGGYSMPYLAIVLSRTQL